MNPYYPLIRKSRLYSVLVLEGLISRVARRLFLKLGLLAVLVFVGFYVWTGLSNILIGVVLILVSLILAVWLLDLFFRSYFYESIITNEYQADDLFTFTVGRILYRVDQQGVLAAFLFSPVGRQITARLGIPASQVTGFLSTHHDPEQSSLTATPPEVITLRSLVTWLWLAHPDWQQWLLYFDLSQEDLLAVTAWAVRDIETAARRERWWSKDNLERIPTIARDWSYGETYNLERFSRDLTASVELASIPREELRTKETVELETILSRSQEANALLVGPAGETLLSVLWQFARAMKIGSVLPALRGKRLILINTTQLLADVHTREAFEAGVLKIFNEAARAGNVIVAIDNAATLLQGGESLGVDLLALLDPYLTGNRLQVIALTEVDVFHRELESRSALMNRFEKVNVEETNDVRLRTLLEDQAERLEKQYPIVITYPAIAEIIKVAGQYFQADSLSDKASDLLVESVPWALGHQESSVRRETIQSLTKEKTNIPLGTIDAAEQQKLLGLEGALRARVIGQTEGLKAVANAMRRGRTALANPKRPMGSFLFLGPTGVGKTETAKALAATFFGREDALLRLDMSEYQTTDALERLIGSFTTRQTGVLATLLRQNPYGVLLLDEFEKAHPKVLNLFLQVLDEGFFSDMLGRRVNVRNIIFIATSNAGAELIWQLLHAGTDFRGVKDRVINEVISKGIYKPELINRFDDVIVFHPLERPELAQVARLQLEKLATRLKNQGIILDITDGLVNTVVEKGSDKLFGARPMQRFIQDEVEKRLAEAMIRGQIHSGGHVSFGDNLGLTVH